MERFIIAGKDFIEAVNKTANILLQPKHSWLFTNACVIVHNDRVDFTAVAPGMLIVHTIPAEVEGAENQKYLINTKALKYVADRTLSNDEVEIILERIKVKSETELEPASKITFKSSNYNLTTKPASESLYDEYPDYRKVIPKEYDAVVEISKQDLIDALNKAVAKRTWERDGIGKYEVVCLKLSIGSIGIEAPDYTTGKKIYKTIDTDAIVKSNEDVRVFVRDVYLEKILSLMDSDDIVMQINTLLRIVITPKDGQGRTIGIVETGLPLWE